MYLAWHAESVGRVLIVGSGFAGLWAALAAARRVHEIGSEATAVEITVISDRPFHDIRVRNYETDLSACRIPLETLLDPVGVGHIVADVTAIDVEARTVTAQQGPARRRDRDGGQDHEEDHQHRTDLSTAHR